jgi:hypothetical protein
MPRSEQRKITTAGAASRTAPLSALATEEAIDVVALDDQSDAIGCFRPYPTVLPHMISEVFPNMVGEVLAGRTSWS